MVGPPPGPLQIKEISRSVTITGIQVDRGTTASIGITIPVDEETLSSPLVLDGVGLIDATPRFLLNGAFVSTAAGERYSCTGSALHFPPKGCTMFPIQGWRISADALAHRGFHIVLGIAPSGDVHADSFAAVAVSYHSVDGQAYELVVPQGGERMPTRLTGLSPGTR